MTKDPLGKIFRVEKKLGRGDLFEFISFFPNGTRTVQVFHHESFDGMGALLTESKKWTGANITVPLFNLKTHPSFIQILEGLRGLIKDMTPSITHWNHLNKDAKYSPEHLAWRVFSAEATQKILSVAREQKVSLNTLLLYVFNATVADNLLSPQQKDCRWLIPVNMRRTEPERVFTGNRTSSVGLWFERDATLSDIESEYRKSLNKWRALAANTLAKASSFLSERVLYRLARRRGENNFWIGSFTNLGVWSFPMITDCQNWPIALSVCPPAGTPCFPIGAGIVTWQGHLSVSLRLNAGLISDNQALPEDLLDELTNRLSGMVKSSLETIRSSRAAH
jgi:NRPS condensation-like uncharacterized protein